MSQCRSVVDRNKTKPCVVTWRRELGAELVAAWFLHRGRQLLGHAMNFRVHVALKVSCTYLKFLFQSLGFGNSFLKDHYMENTKF